MHKEGIEFYERIGFFQTNRGTLIAPSSDNIPYSNDRGDTWVEAPYPVTGARSFRRCFDFVQLPTERILAACIGGVAYSDDEGHTWQTSELWKETYYPYTAEDVEVLPNGLALVLADGPDFPSNNIYSSDDGVVWEPRGLILDPEGNDHWPILLQASTGDVFGVTTYWNRTDVFRMADEGATWTWLDQSLELPESFRVESPVMGPDDRIYIVITYSGPSSGFPPEAGLYRTPDPVAVAVEPGATSPSATPLVVFPNPASDRIAIRGANIDEPVVLYDMVGRAVSCTVIPAAIDVSALPMGFTSFG